MATQIIKGFPRCPDRLDEGHRQQFVRDGYLAFEGVVGPDEVEEAKDALFELTAELLEQARRGEAEVVHPAKDATRNYTGVRIQKQGSPAQVHFEPGFDPLAMTAEEAELKIRKLHAYEQEHPVFQSLVTHPKIKGFVETLLGHQAILRGAMALSKPPFIGSEKPWHQDNAYFVHVPLDSVITAWIALDDATVENGCMYVIPRGHVGGALKHAPRCLWRQTAPRLLAQWRSGLSGRGRRDGSWGRIGRLRSWDYQEMEVVARKSQSPISHEIVESCMREACLRYGLLEKRGKVVTQKVTTFQFRLSFDSASSSISSPQKGERHGDRTDCRASAACRFGGPQGRLEALGPLSQ